MDSIALRGKTLTLPAFFPDATCGYVKCLDTADLKTTRTQGVVVNTYHLWRMGLVDHLKDKGGIHTYMNWDGPVISDSGGFQVFSLVRKHKRFGELTDDGVVFRYNGQAFTLTPEKCIELQLAIGADIIMVLDDCTHPSYDHAEQKRSVARTVAWAKRCKTYFDLHTQQENRPRIFGIIQGGNDLQLRSECAKALLEMQFDGLAFGGWPVQDGVLLTAILAHTASLIPDSMLKYAMGVGKPADIVQCHKMGYNVFDCVLPTRDGRHRRVYRFTDDALGYETMNVSRAKHAGTVQPIDPKCSCHACTHTSLAYLAYAFHEGDPGAKRLVTIHNLTFFAEFMRRLAVQ